MNKILKWWVATGVVTVAFWGCQSSVESLPAPSTQAGSGATQAIAGSTGAAAGSAGSCAMNCASKPPLAEKCPQLPAKAGIVLSACCQSNNTCGVDGSSLNRGCMSYSELKKFFSFATPAETMCDGTPIAASPAAGSGGAANP